jgi:hypothetical protein
MNGQNFIAVGMAACALLLFPGAEAQQKDRDTMVRDDRSAMQNSSTWIYNDVEKGFEMAKKDGRPLLIVFR